jgi:hypothetical protein
MIGQQYGIKGKPVSRPILHHPDSTVKQAIGGKGSHDKVLKIEDCIFIVLYLILFSLPSSENLQRQRKMDQIP